MGTGTLQCVDIGVIATIASYIGIGAVAPVSLSASTGLDPNIDHFGSSSGYFLSATQAGAVTIVGSATSVTSTAACTAAASDPGRSTFQCAPFAAGVTIYITIVTSIGTIVVTIRF